MKLIVYGLIVILSLIGMMGEPVTMIEAWYYLYYLSLGTIGSISAIVVSNEIKKGVKK